MSDFERLFAEADRLADDALADAARSENFSTTQKHLLDEQTKVEGLRKTIQDLEIKRDQDWSAYVALWQAAGIVPLPPAEMAHWLQSVGKLRTLREELETARTTLQTIDSAVEGIVPTLVRLVADLGLWRAQAFTPKACSSPSR